MITLKRYSANTHQGPYLQLNEDDHDIDIINNLFMVFDGFGGSNAGDKAVELLKNNIKDFYTKLSDDPDSTLPFFYSYKYLLEGNALINAIQNAHKVLLKDNASKDLSKRGGAAAICSSLSENIMTLVSVGNCASYLFRNGTLSPITHPDTMGQLSKDNFNFHLLSCPMSGFGLFEDLHTEVREVRVAENDIVLILTDGAFNRLKEEELEFILREKSPDLSEKIKEIFKLSNSRGNLDNQTGVILEF